MPRDNKKSGGIRWRLWLGLAAACLVCASTAIAALQLHDYLSTDARFVLSCMIPSGPAASTERS